MNCNFALRFALATHQRKIRVLFLVAKQLQILHQLFHWMLVFRLWIQELVRKRALGKTQEDPETSEGLR